MKSVLRTTTLEGTEARLKLETFTNSPVSYYGRQSSELIPFFVPINPENREVK